MTLTLTPEHLAAEASRTGLLGAFISHDPDVAAWVFNRPGHDEDGKTFPYTLRGKDAARREAETWARLRFGVRSWQTIPGLGGTRWPLDLVVWATSLVRMSKARPKTSA